MLNIALPTAIPLHLPDLSMPWQIHDWIISASGSKISVFKCDRWVEDRCSWLLNRVQWQCPPCEQGLAGRPYTLSQKGQCRTISNLRLDSSTHLEPGLHRGPCSSYLGAVHGHLFSALRNFPPLFSYSDGSTATQSVCSRSSHFGKNLTMN